MCVRKIGKSINNLSDCSNIRQAHVIRIHCASSPFPSKPTFLSISISSTVEQAVKKKNGLQRQTVFEFLTKHWCIVLPFHNHLLSLSVTQFMRAVLSEAQGAAKYSKQTRVYNRLIQDERQKAEWTTLLLSGANISKINKTFVEQQKY